MQVHHYPLWCTLRWNHLRTVWIAITGIVLENIWMFLQSPLLSLSCPSRYPGTSSSFRTRCPNVTWIPLNDHNDISSEGSLIGTGLHLLLKTEYVSAVILKSNHRPVKWSKHSNYLPSRATNLIGNQISKSLVHLSLGPLSNSAREL